MHYFQWVAAVAGPHKTKGSPLSSVKQQNFKSQQQKTVCIINMWSGPALSKGLTMICPGGSSELQKSHGCHNFHSIRRSLLLWTRNLTASCKAYKSCKAWKNFLNKCWRWLQEKTKAGIFSLAVSLWRLRMLCKINTWIPAIMKICLAGFIHCYTFQL